jgi:hypothetical protein
MSAGKRKRVFTAEVVQAHMRAKHGRCPEDVLEKIVRRVIARAWSPPVELGRAVGIIASNFVRHQLTDYERMLDVNGMTREEARVIVAAEVEGIIASWASH